MVRRVGRFLLAVLGCLVAAGVAGVLGSLLWRDDSGWQQLAFTVATAPSGLVGAWSAVYLSGRLSGATVPAPLGTVALAYGLLYTVQSARSSGHVLPDTTAVVFLVVGTAGLVALLAGLASAAVLGRRRAAAASDGASAAEPTAD